MSIFTPENWQLLPRAAVPPIFVEVKCPVPNSNLSYFFMDRALPFHCYFLSVTERKIFFSSPNHMCNCQLCHCPAVQLCQPCTNYLHTFAHLQTCTLFTLTHTFAHFFAHFLCMQYCKLTHFWHLCTILHTFALFWTSGCEQQVVADTAWGRVF